MSCTESQTALAAPDVRATCFRQLGAAAYRLCLTPAPDSRGAVPPPAPAGPGAQACLGSPLPYPGMTALSEEDLACVEQRHLCRKPQQPRADSLSAQIIGGGRRCRHGWPQAVLYDPLYQSTPGKHYRLGDTTRLTCPLLVTALDKIEKAGAMAIYNERLQTDPTWAGQLDRVNEAHRLLREHVVSDRPTQMAEVRSHLGEATYATAMSAGLASMRKGTQDVKCLHAQVADELIRGGQNLIALQALKDIEDMGIPVDGSDECCDNCNLQVPLEDARWRLQKCKNNAGKRLSRHRKATAPSRAQPQVGNDSSRDR